MEARRDMSELNRLSNHRSSDTVAVALALMLKCAGKKPLNATLPEARTNPQSPAFPATDTHPTTKLNGICSAYGAPAEEAAPDTYNRPPAGHAMGLKSLSPGRPFSTGNTEEVGCVRLRQGFPAWSW